MAYYLTYDERYYGGYISGVAGSRDAPDSTSTADFTISVVDDPSDNNFIGGMA